MAPPPACVALSQADPEETIGDYLHEGMTLALGRLHARLKHAPFKPLHVGKPTERAREPKEVIQNAFFNVLCVCVECLLVCVHAHIAVLVHIAERIVKHIVTICPTICVPIVSFVYMLAIYALLYATPTI